MGVGAERLALRPADLNDADFLLELRNDPTTRRFSFTQHHISRSEHMAWLSQRLSDPASLIWIVLCDERQAGQLRLTQIDSLTAEVHIAVAPEFRGQGLAREILLHVASLCKASWPRITHLRARIVAENEASLRAFCAAGFKEVKNSDEQRYRVLECALSINQQP